MLLAESVHSANHNNNNSEELQHLNGSSNDVHNETLTKEHCDSVSSSSSASECHKLAGGDNKDCATVTPGTEDEAALKRIKEMPRTLSQGGEGQFKCYSKNGSWFFNVNLQQDPTPSQQKCYILTIPDLGFDSTRFQQFISSEEMEGIRSRVVWLHVTMPGQEPDAEDLTMDRYPSFDELADELVCVLEHFKVPQAIFMGDGAGANIAARFAMKHSNRCLGVVLVEPNGSPAGFIESMKFRINNLNLFSNRTGMSQEERAALICNRFGKQIHDLESSQIPLHQSETKLFDNCNQKNLLLYIESFVVRSNILDKLNSMKMDSLVTISKRSTTYQESKKFYKTLKETRKKDPKSLVNCPSLEVETVSNVMIEAPDRLATSLQYFLQGIGLVSAMPMQPPHSKKPRGSTVSAMSAMSDTSQIQAGEEAGDNKPRTDSITTESSAFVSSNVSISSD